MRLRALIDWFRTKRKGEVDPNDRESGPTGMTAPLRCYPSMTERKPNTSSSDFER